MESLYIFSPGCAVGSQVCHVIKAPRHPGTPSWVTRRRGTRSRSCPPSWCRRSGWPGVRTPASRSSGLSTDTPPERRSHRAKRGSARSAETHKTISLYCAHNRVKNGGINFLAAIPAVLNGEQTRKIWSKLYCACLIHTKTKEIQILSYKKLKLAHLIQIN